jgi:hypothetical protein
VSKKEFKKISKGSKKKYFLESDKMEDSHFKISHNFSKLKLIITSNNWKNKKYRINNKFN